MVEIYCVIQEVKLKKPNKYGSYKELKVDSCSLDGEIKYGYTYGHEKFERSVNKAYKISIHESKRVKGVVTKRQKSVTTMGYYDILEFCIEDCILNSKLENIASYFKISVKHLLDIIYKKFIPFSEKIEQEFSETEEYKTREKHKKIIREYNNAKAEFANKYNVDSDEYDYCYNIFGELMNKTYLDKIINNVKSSSYYKGSYSNYSYDDSDYDDFDYSSYSKTTNSNYTETEKGYLKKIYRMLSKQYHPDNGNDNEMMGFINRLKTEWGI